MALWRERAAAATDELEAMQRRAKSDAEARAALEKELRGARTNRRAAEEELHPEVDRLRERARRRGAEWDARCAEAEEARASAEGQLRALQVSTRAGEATMEATVEAAREEAAAARIREARLESELARFAPTPTDSSED